MNCKTLAKEYSNNNHTHSLSISFGKILMDLKDLGIIEEWNNTRARKTYKKVINPDNIEALRNGNK